MKKKTFLNKSKTDIKKTKSLTQFKVNKKKYITPNKLKNKRLICSFYTFYTEKSQNLINLIKCFF